MTLGIFCAMEIQGDKNDIPGKTVDRDLLLLQLSNGDGYLSYSMFLLELQMFLISKSEASLILDWSIGGRVYCQELFVHILFSKRKQNTAE